jgi:acetyl esterase/lipase
MVQIIFFLYRSVILFIGGNENTKVGVAGDSAGGLIAASICQTIKNLDFQVEIFISNQKFDFLFKQILICGQFDYFHQSFSRKEFNRPMFIITADVLDWYYK